MPTIAVRAVREHSPRMDEELLKLGPERQGSGLVFVGPVGGRIEPDRVTDKLKRILDGDSLPSDGFTLCGRQEE